MGQAVRGGFRQSNLVQAWLVLLLAACFGSALAAVHINLSGIINENKRNETFSKIPVLVLGADRSVQVNNEKITIKITPGTFQVEKAGKAIYYPIYRVNVEEQLAGWVIKASGQGYSGNIELLLGLDPQAAIITGLFILEQKETPGLGNKIISLDWRNQFVHKDISQPLLLKKAGRREQQASAGNGIDAITGATISSRAVTSIVNGIISNIKGNLSPDRIQYFERQM